MKKSLLTVAVTLFFLAGVPPLVSAKTKAIAKKKTPTAQATAAPAAAAAPVQEVWPADWIKKYVTVTPKEGYTHVFLDVETMKDKFQGDAVKPLSALEAYHASVAGVVPSGAPDLMKMDVVLFGSRDNYGAPQWDSMKRLAHMEFSRKALSGAGADVFSKGEAAWKGLFTAFQLY